MYIILLLFSIILFISCYLSVRRDHDLGSNFDVDISNVSPSTLCNLRQAIFLQKFHESLADNVNFRKE